MTLPILPPGTGSPDNPALHLIIGDPIAQSLSPLIYNTLYTHHQMPVQAMTCRVPSEELPHFFALIRGMNVCAINVTIPHKGGVIAHLDWVDPSAKAQGSVNSILVRNGKMRGYSTDGPGLSLSMGEEGVSMTGKRVLLLGNGGAAAAIAWQAVQEDAKTLTVISRQRERAAALLAQLPQNANALFADNDMEALPRHAAQADVLINATPLGMTGFAGGDFPSLAFLQSLPPWAAVCDIVYKPACTALLAEARRLGLKTVEGLGMLIWQAMAAFDIYYGIVPSQEDRAAIKALAAARLSG